MTRITKALTEQIIEHALTKAGITEARKALDEKLQNWAEHARVESLGGPAEVARIERILDEIKQLRASLPSGLDHNARIANIAKRDYFRVGGERVDIEFPEYRLTLYQVSFEADHPLAKAYRKIEVERSKVESKAGEITTKVRATVRQFSTIKRLLEAWPEALELIPATLGVTTCLPAIRTEDLNKLVGLP